MVSNSVSTFTLLSFLQLLPAALRAAQACQYLIYSEANFEVFRPAGVTRCTDGGEIWHGGGDLWTMQISPPSVQRVAPAGEKPHNRPLSKLNTGRLALRAMLPVKVLVKLL